MQAVQLGSIHCTWQMYMQTTTRIIVNKSWRVYIVHGRYDQTTIRMLSTNVSTQTVETKINSTKVYDWAIQCINMCKMRHLSIAKNYPIVQHCIKWMWFPMLFFSHHWKGSWQLVEDAL